MDFCCCQWLELGKELAELKLKSLQKLVKRGIPRSTFSPIFRQLESITNFCPSCGNKLSQAPAQEKVKTPPPEPEIKSLPTIKCPPCRGTGRVGDGVACMTCLGSGVIDKSNPNRSRYDPVFASEQTEKMERVTRRITEKETEIAKNPKPLREDATPESIKKI